MGPRAIAACTELIRAADADQVVLSSYYFVRGLNYEYAGACDRAIADFDTSLRMRPFPDAYLNRGACFLATRSWARATSDFERVMTAGPVFTGSIARAYFLRGVSYLDRDDERRAIADFGTSYATDGRGGETLFYRGLAYFRAGDDVRAGLDFAAAIQAFPSLAIYTSGANARPFVGLFVTGDAIEGGPPGIDPLQPYAVLLEHIAAAGAGRDDRDEFAANAAALDPSAWPAPLIAYFSKTATAAGVLHAAFEGDAALSSARICETVFFLGEDAALRHDAARASRLFASALGRCTEEELAYGLARSEVRRGAR